MKWNVENFEEIFMNTEVWRRRRIYGGFTADLRRRRSGGGLTNFCNPKLLLLPFCSSAPRTPDFFTAIKLLKDSKSLFLTFFAWFSNLKKNWIWNQFLLEFYWIFFPISSTMDKRISRSSILWGGAQDDSRFGWYDLDQYFVVSENFKN